MNTIIVASTNPVKIKAAEEGFKRMFPEEPVVVSAVDVPSNVGNQPWGNEETLQGAKTRAENARRVKPHADFWVGIEGGIEEENGNMAAFAWIVILSSSHLGMARTGTFFLPRVVAELIRTGYELGDADDIIFIKTNSKQENGAIGILTGNVLTRTSLYEHAVNLALVPFKNTSLY